ncbi:hypothetical protein SCLCIDRAFT_34724 [Scleroderma citrinum Foug A]|uniref:Uncharacterized protein n=1 Tax=Scleroderma citrinum Foug A TaxID=1036808 RepID=A0A0C3CMY9_9AGAM|nr:hypothetical protein SCLCIDRAFT_34724 [Scleroderma citrinum Foug A]
MPEHNNYGTSSSNVQNATPRGESENERIERAERTLRGKVPSPLEARGPSMFKEFPTNLMNDTRLDVEEPVILTEFRQSFTVDVLFSLSFLLTGVNGKTPRCPAFKTLTSLPRKVRS